MTTVIRAAAAADAEPITRIYNHYIAETNVTFETDPLPPSDIAQRIREHDAASLPWLVAEVTGKRGVAQAADASGQIVGFASASDWKGRCAYRYSVEVTVYVDPERGGQGIGSHLYGHLLPALAKAGYHSAIGGIALPNEASIALHEKFGFVKVAHFREVGFKFDQWIDVGYWQLILKKDE